VDTKDDLVLGFVDHRRGAIHFMTDIAFDE
jgi:hypothetical protein